jgi:hypothetical protein
MPKKKQKQKQQDNPDAVQPFIVKTAATYWDEEHREVREYALLKGAWPKLPHPKTGEPRQVVCRFTGVGAVIFGERRVPFEFPLPDSITVEEAFAEYKRRVREEAEWYRDYQTQLARQRMQRAMLENPSQGRIITPGH